MSHPVKDVNRTYKDGTIVYTTPEQAIKYAEGANFIVTEDVVEAGTYNAVHPSESQVHFVLVRMGREAWIWSKVIEFVSH